MRNPLTDFRERRGLNLAEAQVLLGVPYTQLSRVEGGYDKPTARLLARLAELGEDPKAFMAAYDKYVAARRQVIELRPAVAAAAAVVAKGAE